MNYYLLIPLLLSVALIIILIIILHKNKNKLSETNSKLNYYKTIRHDELKACFEEEWKEKEREEEDKLRIKRDGLEKEWQFIFQKHNDQISKLDTEVKHLDSILKEKEKRYNEVNADLDLYKKGKISEIDNTAAEYKQHQQTVIKEELEKYREYWTNEFNNELVKISESKDKALNELKEITIDLEIERSKRAAINEEIRRQRQVEEEQDFYRIQLDSEDKDDVEILRNVAPRLRHPEAINKVIWTGYYQKPLAELRKRLLPNGDISGVYKITRLKTGEIYIGQSTSIDKRYQEHTKTALGVGNLASSQLHRAMSKDGPEQFTWEILEEVPKDKLRERESYYIDFYDSKTYGLNSITGDKNK